MILYLNIYDFCFFIIPHESFGRELLIGGTTKNPKKAKKACVYNSAPCYGYTLPTNDLHGLKKENRKLSNFRGKSRINIIPSIKQDNQDKLFEILDKFQRKHKS